MTFTFKLKPSDCTVSKYNEKVVLRYRTITRSTTFEVSIKCSLSHALEHYGTIDRILLESPEGVRALEFIGYDFVDSEREEARENENFNGCHDMPCGSTSGH